MSLALFLDLDGVLTPKAVNLQFAAMLGIEDRLLVLEDRYSTGSISNDEYNESFIPLFRDAGFSETFIRDHFKDIQLSPFAEELIQINLPNVFIVTSSPSYFVDQFARRFGIAPQNYICSKYTFERDGLLRSCSFGCGVVEKAEFVRSREALYTASIGIGDSPEQDGRFLNECDVRILLGGERRNYLHADDLYAAVTLVKLLRDAFDSSDASDQTPDACVRGVERLLGHSTLSSNIFIMTPIRPDARYRVAISSIKAELRDADYRGWTADDLDLDPNHDLWTNVRCFMHGCRYGIALIAAQETIEADAIRIRDDIFNPNVMLEAGYMLGQGKEALLLKDSRVRMPTDWLGKLFSPIDFVNPESDVRSAVRRWVKR